MELQIKDRLYLPTFLPKEGTYQEWNLKKNILKKIAITDQEREEVGLKENAETKRIEWDVEKDTPVNIDLSTEEVEFLKTSCEKMAEEALPDDMWGVVEKIYNTAIS